MTTLIRILICEDSRAYAAALARTLEYDGGITVVATCGNAEDAIAALPVVQPDIVTMDIGLPGMNGLQATEEIMGTWPLPILVLFSTVASRRHNAAAALAAGALDALAKDDLDLGAPESEAAAAFRERIKMLGRAHVLRHPRARLRVTAPAQDATSRRASVIGVCASTGGPATLAHLLEALPAGYAIPILVVQHIAPAFTDGLARWLGDAARMPVRVVADGALADPGVWIAPGGAHLVLDATGRLRLEQGAAPRRHQPSGDVLFASIVAAAGKSGVAVVLSGMGSDGASGAAAVQRAGGLAIAQDEATSAIYGMPKAAADAGVKVVLSPTEIVTRLLGLRWEPLVSAR